MKQLLDRRLKDADAEAVRRATYEAIREIQAMPVMEMRVVRNIKVTSNDFVVIAHQLGRAPTFVVPTAVRFLPAESATLSVGTWFDYGVTGPAGEPIDRSKIVILSAAGWTSGAAVHLTFDLLVG